MSSHAVRVAILELLQADPGLLALIDSDDAIYHRSAPQDRPFPFVIFFKQSGTPEYALGGGFIDDELWTVKGVDKGLSAQTAEAIDERLRAVLQDAELNLDGEATLYFRRVSDLDMGEAEEGGTIHHVGAIYRLVREAT